MLVVIGIVHCPSISELSATYGEFQRMCEQFPEALTCRCFAFEPSDQQISEDSQALQDMVLFPPGEVSTSESIFAYKPIPFSVADPQTWLSCIWLLYSGPDKAWFMMFNVNLIQALSITAPHYLAIF